MTGRPSTFTPEIGDQVCRLVTEGKTLRWIAKHYPNAPWKSTVQNWLYGEEFDQVEAVQRFRQQYARARDVKIESMSDEIVELADDTAQDPNRSRLQVDTRKWLMSKLLPRKYGDKVEVNGTLTLAAFVDQIERAVHPVIEHEAQDVVSDAPQPSESALQPRVISEK